MTILSVFRFEDFGSRSHVIASSKIRAIEIFDVMMGKEYREDEEDEMEIYVLDDSTLIPISDDGSPPYEEKTVRQWIENDPTERFL